MITAHDANAAGLCMFGLHAAKAADPERWPGHVWPAVTHEVSYLDEREMLAIPMCADCAEAHRKLGAEVHEIGRGVA